mmetsp:Transcript_9169/g.17226  ORF Transcript_9169/g.17226 Transcript_9169/m.17226 type:complete len:118 (-) Transcript_9169:605-958(-)
MKDEATNSPLFKFTTPKRNRNKTQEKCSTTVPLLMTLVRILIPFSSFPLFRPLIFLLRSPSPKVPSPISVLYERANLIAPFHHFITCAFRRATAEVVDKEFFGGHAILNASESYLCC